jgi:uncharacterized membrane protein YedE/YeeE
MTEFTPFASLAGGALIGLAAVGLMLLNGQIAGVSNIAGRLVPPFSDDWGWRLAFIGGLVAAPVLVELVTGAPVARTISPALVPMAAAGLLVGFGSVLGNGCTSGHGVCGIARVSPRSLAATAIFMTVAFVTVFVVRHGLGS